MSAITRFRGFVDATWGELKRTSWPTKREVYGHTLVVVVFVIIVGLFLHVVDLVLAQASSLFFGWLGG